MTALTDVGVSGFEDAEGISAEQRRNIESANRIRERLLDAGLLPQMPSYRYFQRGAGPMFCWTTKRMEGKFVSFVYKPVGPGARAGEAESWVFVDRLEVRHAKRKIAKARALRLYKRWRETGRLP